MEKCSAILVEFSGFLFHHDEEFAVMQVYQDIDEEAKELLLEMQEYTDIIGFCCTDPRATQILKSRMELEGLRFKDIFAVERDSYNALKLSVLPTLRSKYQIKKYIDETENSPWSKKSLCLFRLKY